jgi:hypothetical protein
LPTCDTFSLETTGTLDVHAVFSEVYAEKMIVNDFLDDGEVKLIDFRFPDVTVGKVAKSLTDFLTNQIPKADMVFSEARMGFVQTSYETLHETLNGVIHTDSHF